MKVVVLLGLVCVNGLRIPTGDIFLEKQKVLDKFRFPLDSAGVAQRPNLPRSSSAVRRLVSPQGGIEFVVEGQVHPSTRHQLDTALQIAGGFLENAISFSQPINVKVKVGSECLNGEACNSNAMLLGECKPNSQIVTGPYGDMISYPNSLVKQLPKGSLHYTYTMKHYDFDMTVHLKLTHQTVFPNDYGSRKFDMKWDIMETIIHEIIHGLGITSGSRTRFTNPTFVGPAYILNRTGTMVKVNFIKTLFDTYLYTDLNKKHGFDGSPRIDEIIRPMDFNADLQYEPEPLDKIPRMQQINQLSELSSTQNSTFFKTWKGTKVYVETNLHSSSLSSFSHVDKLTYMFSKDYLMVHTANPYGYFLRDNSLDDDWITAPIGEHTIEMLETLGYKRNPNSKRERSQLALYQQMRSFNYKAEELEYFYFPDPPFKYLYSNHP